MTWVSKYVGIPFEERGRGPGYDCWGLYWLILKEEFGKSLPSYSESYGSWKDKKLASLIEEESKLWIEIPIGEEEEGDAIVFRMRSINDGNLVDSRHVGVVIDRGKMIHITRGVDACIEKYMTPLWRNRIVGIFRSK